MSFMSEADEQNEAESKEAQSRELIKKLAKLHGIKCEDTDEWENMFVSKFKDGTGW